MFNRDSIKRVCTLLAVTAGIFGTTFTLWPAVVRWNQHQLVSQLTTQIKAADDDHVRAPLRQLASLGNAAIVPLVEASASERTVVATIARKIINEQFESWRLQAESSRNFAYVTPTTTLAEALADHIGKYGPLGRKWAESLAIRLIVLAEAIPANQAPKMLEDCTYILAEIPASGPKLRNIRTTVPQAMPETSHPLGTPNISMRAFAVPSESVINVPRPAPPELGQGATALPANSPKALKSTLTTRQASPSLPSNWSPDWGNNDAYVAPTEPMASMPVQPITPPSPPKTSRPRQSAALFVDIPSPAEIDQQMKRLRQKTSQQLVRLLPRNDIYEAGPIRAVLRERGLTEPEMSFTKQFSSAQVGDRLKLIEDLSVLPASTARRWLRWLLEDKDAEVRLRALTAIATTSDPALYDLAREIAVNDQDHRVAQLASQIMKNTR